MKLAKNIMEDVWDFCTEQMEEYFGWLWDIGYWWPLTIPVWPFCLWCFLGSFVLVLLTFVFVIPVVAVVWILSFGKVSL